MKRILLALTIVGFLLPLSPRAQAQAEVSLNFFYDNLSPSGTWLDVTDYGYCFQPNVAANNPSWRPYADGYWAYTDAGWTWVSYEDFGWATYHYGRWSHLADYGWVWVPGYEWGPAWVSWRTGGDYIGWAPLPPSGERIYEGRAITGQVDIAFDIGPQYYNFIDIRYIGEPVLRDRIFEPQRNVTIINRTVNVTNITYSNSTVYNYGPDFNRLNQYSTRPIQRLSLQRETQVSAGLSGGANLNRVNGNQLVVVAPKIQRTEQRIAPKQVKAKVAQPKVERGWQGVADRAKLQQAMKSENAQNVPPPSFQPQQGRKQEAAIETQATTPGGATQANEPAGATQPRAGQAAAAPNEQQVGKPGKGPRKGLRNAPPTEQASPAAEQAGQTGLAPGNEAERSQEQGKKHNARAEKAPREQQQPSPQSDEMQSQRPMKAQRAHEQATQQAEQPQEQQPERTDRAKVRHAERPAQAEGAQPEPQRTERPERPEQAQPSQETQRPERAQRSQQPRRVEQAPRPEAPPQAQQGHRAEQAQPPRGAGAPEGQAGAQQGKGKKKKPVESPSPTP